jgi:hypothetical protein
MQDEEDEANGEEVTAFDAAFEGSEDGSSTPKKTPKMSEDRKKAQFDAIKTSISSGLIELHYKAESNDSVTISTIVHAVGDVMDSTMTDYFTAIDPKLISEIGDIVQTKVFDEFKSAINTFVNSGQSGGEPEAFEGGAILPGENNKKTTKTNRISTPTFFTKPSTLNLFKIIKNHVLNQKMV